MRIDAARLAQSLFKKLDTDGDGQLSSGEAGGSPTLGGRTDVYLSASAARDIIIKLDPMEQQDLAAKAARCDHLSLLGNAITGTFFALIVGGVGGTIFLPVLPFWAAVATVAALGVVVLCAATQAGSGFTTMFDKHKDTLARTAGTLLYKSPSH